MKYMEEEGPVDDKTSQAFKVPEHKTPLGDAIAARNSRPTPTEPQTSKFEEVKMEQGALVRDKLARSARGALSSRIAKEPTPVKAK